VDQEPIDVPQHLVDQGVQVDPTIRAGPPCGLTADLLARVVVANPAMGPGTVADLFAQRPVDLTEHQTLRWAAEAAAAVEGFTARRIIYGVMGAWYNRQDPEEVIQWLRSILQDVVSRPSV